MSKSVSCYEKKGLIYVYICLEQMDDTGLGISLPKRKEKKTQEGVLPNIECKRGTY